MITKVDITAQNDRFLGSLSLGSVAGGNLPSALRSALFGLAEICKAVGAVRSWLLGASLGSVRQTPTAPIAAASFIGGYAMASASGSRALGGVVLALGGLWCGWLWYARLGARTAAALGALSLLALVLSHLLALLIGAWPAVLVVAGAVAVGVYSRADLGAHSLASRAERL
ncbi:MAG TPA: hypothetical protein VID48_15845 [Solirubrobacteraceae bacterium]